MLKGGDPIEWVKTLPQDLVIVPQEEGFKLHLPTITIWSYNLVDKLD